jgi:type VI secretion system secreted protein VgrG
MPNNIYAAIEQLGLSAQKRAIHIQFSNTSLNESFVAQTYL